MKEAIPPNAPEPRGTEVYMRIFVDSYHAVDKLTRRYRTGYIIFLNNGPIVWFSKKQATIENSVLGAEFVALDIGIEKLRVFLYKLLIMVVPILLPSLIYGDNMSVIHNTQRSDSTLKKNPNSIFYRAIRESVAMK